MSTPDTALVLPLPTDADLQPYRDAAAQYRAYADGLAIGGDEALGTAITSLAEIATVNRQGEAHRKRLVGPLNEHTKKINDVFHLVLDPVAEAERIVKRKIGDYQLERRRKAEEAARLAELERRRLEAEALQRAEEAVRAAQAASEAPTLPLFVERQEQAVATAGAAQEAAAKAAAPILTPAPPAKTVQVGGAKATVKTRWTFKLTDFQKVPRAFLVLNETSVRKALDAGIREIPGLDIVEEPEVSVSVKAGTPAPRRAAIPPVVTKPGGKYGW